LKRRWTVQGTTYPSSSALQAAAVCSIEPWWAKDNEYLIAFSFFKQILEHGASTLIYAYMFLLL
jgi:hypothetical protein